MRELKLRKVEDFFLKLVACEKCFPRKIKLTLPGTGNFDADLMIVGESPSIHRKHNETFGMKSKPVIESLLREIGLSREEVYMTNVVKCIIPKKTTGDPVKCIEYLKEEIELIDPKVVLLLGKVASYHVLKERRFGKVVTQIDGRTYITWYHPMNVIYGRMTIEDYVKIAETVRRCLDGVHKC